MDAEQIKELWDEDQHDVFISIDQGFERAYEVVGSRRRLIAVANDADNIFKEIYRYLDSQAFYPNIWHVNDHGNVTLYDCYGQVIGAMV